MAPRRGNDEDLEIFTDLNGGASPADASDAMLLDDVSKLGKEKGSKKNDDDDEDDDLEIVDDAEGDEDGDDDAGEGDDKDESGEGEGAEAAAEEEADPEILFDPKDVQLIIAESKALEGRETTVKADEARAKADAESAKEAMAKAMEDGDTKAHVAAAEKFADAKGAIQTAAAKLENITGEKTALAARANACLAKAPKNEKGEAIVDKIVFKKSAGASPSGKTAGSKLASKFTELNPWFNDAAKKGMREVLLGIDRALAAEKKLDKNSKEYFTELGKRFNKLHPGVFKDLDGKLVATGTRQRGAGQQIPGSGGGGGGQKDQQAKGKIRLTSDDVKQMRIFNVDPDDPKVRRAWLNEKIASATRDARRKVA